MGFLPVTGCRIGDRGLRKTTSSSLAGALLPPTTREKTLHLCPLSVASRRFGKFAISALGEVAFRFA
jgi:hypothetical protein